MFVQPKEKTRDVFSYLVKVYIEDEGTHFSEMHSGRWKAMNPNYPKGNSE